MLCNDTLLHLEEFLEIKDADSLALCNKALISKISKRVWNPNLPPHIRHVKFFRRVKMPVCRDLRTMENYDGPLVYCLPPNLTRLSFSTTFYCVIPSLPQSLKFLELPYNYLEYLSIDILPRGLRELILPVYNPFRGEKTNLPPTLTHLSIHGNDFETYASNLKFLRTVCLYGRCDLREALPESVERVYVRGDEDLTNIKSFGWVEQSRDVRKAYDICLVRDGKRKRKIL